MEHETSREIAEALADGRNVEDTTIGSKSLILYVVPTDASKDSPLIAIPKKTRPHDEQVVRSTSEVSLFSNL